MIIYILLNSFFYAVFFINTNSSIIKLTTCNCEIILTSFTLNTFQIFRLRPFDKNKFCLSTYTRSSLVSKAFRFSTQKLAKSEDLGNKAKRKNQWYIICIFFILRRIVNFIMWFNHCLFCHIIDSITPFLSNTFNPSFYL